MAQRKTNASNNQMSTTLKCWALLVCVLKHSHFFEGCWDQRHTTSVIHFCYDPLCVILWEYWYSPSKIIKLRHWSSSLEFLNSKTSQDFFNVREVGLKWRKHDHAIKICISLFFYKKNHIQSLWTLLIISWLSSFPVARMKSVRTSLWTYVHLPISLMNTSS